MGFVLAHDVDQIVVGVDSQAQLDQILAAAHPLATLPPVELSSADIDLVNPARWTAP
jgi:hypothetical protein